MFKTKYIFMGMLLAVLGLSAQAQTSNFSQYHLSPVYTSPGDLAQSDYFQIMAQYRKQSLSADQGFENMAVSGSYPLFYGGGRKFGAIGLGILSESSGMMGLLRENSIRAGYAYSLQLSRTQFVSMGLQGGYYRRSIDASKVTTDEQYNNGQYTPGLPTGENFADFASQAFKVDAGMTWYGQDAYGDQKFSLGVAAFNVNKANYTFLNNSNDQVEPIRFQAHGSIRALQGDRYQLVPTFRYMFEKNYDQLNAGALFLYSLEQGGSVQESHLGVGAWYSVNNAAILSLQYTQPSYVLSISYDLPAAAKIDQHQVNNAVEVSLGWRLNRGKKVKVRAADSRVVSEELPQAEEAAVVVEEAVQDAPAVAQETAPIVEQVEQSSPAVAVAEQPSQEPAPAKELSAEDQQVLGANLGFVSIGSTQLTETAKEELDRIAEVLQQNPDVRVKTIGHTCTVGSEQTNLGLSKRRADVAKKYLLEKGIASTRIETEGKYYLEPIASNATEEGRRQNRRIQFVILQ